MQRQLWIRSGKSSKQYQLGCWKSQKEVATLMDICHLKNEELEPKYHKYKGRVVLRGDVVKDNSGSCCSHRVRFVCVTCDGRRSYGCHCRARRDALSHCFGRCAVGFFFFLQERTWKDNSPLKTTTENLLARSESVKQISQIWHTTVSA